MSGNSLFGVWDIVAQAGEHCKGAILGKIDFLMCQSGFLHEH